jgi:hypothetical protein
MPKSPLTKLPNIWPTTAEALMKIGITTPEEFLARDPYEIFYELKTKVDPTLCRCALAWIVGASTGQKRHTLHKSAAQEFETRYPTMKWHTSWKNC